MVTKFRVYDKLGGKIYDVTEIVFRLDGIRRVKIIGRAPAKRGFVPIDCLMEDRVELLQWTGLKDKNGVEIYAGDILKFDEWHQVGDVQWIEESSFFTAVLVKNPEYEERQHWPISELCQVIGNIHENPELISG